MQVQYKGKLLNDGHLSIPKEIIDKLKIGKRTNLRITVDVEKNPDKNKILSYAGLLSDLTDEENERFNQGIKRRSLFGQREIKI